MIHGLLPVVGGWMYQHKAKSGAIRTGEEEVVARIRSPGYLIRVSALLEGNLDAKYVKLRVTLDGPRSPFPMEFAPHDVEVPGYLGHANFGAFTTLYSDEDMKYSVVICPCRPVPFAEELEVRLIAPSQPVEESTAVSTDYVVEYTVIRITDVRRFRADLRAVLGR